MATFNSFLLPPVPSDLLTLNLFSLTFSTSFFCSCSAKFSLKILSSFLRSESQIIQCLDKARLAFSSCKFEFHLIICIRLSLISNTGFTFPLDNKVKNLLPHFAPIPFCQKFSGIFKAILFSLSLQKLLSFVSTMSISHKPPKPSNSFTNVFFSSAFLVAVPYFPFCVMKKHSVCKYFKFSKDCFYALFCH